jgi:hypothetical protein
MPMVFIISNTICAISPCEPAMLLSETVQIALAKEETRS